MKLFKNLTFTAAATIVALGALAAHAGTFTGTFDGGGGTTYDPNDVGGSGLTDYDKTFSFADGGVTFDVVLNIASDGPAGSNLHVANSGHMGVKQAETSGGSRGLDKADEDLTYTISSITQTGGPLSTIVFDGFTSINLRFAEGPFDAGRITDGTNSLFDFDNSDGTAEVTNATGTPFTVNVAGLPSTLVAEWVAASPGGGSNIWRTNTVGGQFTVTVIPEPASLVFAGCALCAVAIMRSRRS